ncbi:MAG: hypothetical protein JWO63_71 [Frankiales bacterium]|nr:hypothetical protein [Frankiales bacterium]
MLVLLLGAFSTLLLSPSSPAAAATSSSAGPVTVTLDSMTPRSPDATDLTAPVKFTATITNTGDTDYTDFAVGLERGADLHTQSALDAAIADPPPTTNLASSNDQDQRKPLLAHTSIVVTYVTDASAQKMCLCVESVYPYALVVQAETSPDDGFAEVGRTQILVPALLQKPQPVQVSWVWPLIDRPHRTISDTVFTDDLLKASVSPGGRLYRALQAAELVAAAKIRMTLVVDPELLDSLAVMASKQGYEYHSGSRVVVGTGGPAAQAWLDRLAALGPSEDLALTGYGDPDINAATRAGLSYSTALDPQVQARIAPVTSKFSYNPISLTWPAGGALTSKGLDAAISAGSSAVILSDAALSGQNQAEPRPNALSPLPSASGQALALVTDTSIEKTITAAMTLGASPAMAQQTLISQLAIRAVSQPDASHFVMLTPPRYVDTDPAAAAATVLATVRNTWSTSLSINQALLAVTPVDRGPLQTSAESAADEVNATQLSIALSVQQKVASLREAVSCSAAAALLGGFNTGLLRTQSSAWRVDRAGGAAIATELNNSIDAKLSAVSLVKPAEGTYSLSSDNSPLLVTVQNKLSQDVTVRVAVTAGVGVIGFSSPPLTETISAGDKRTISVPAHVDRLGQFKVTATLTTLDGQQLGPAIQLNLRSTSLGGITKVITIVAAAVLIAALVRRAFKRVRLARAGRAVGRHA